MFKRLFYFRHAGQTLVHFMHVERLQGKYAPLLSFLDIILAYDTSYAYATLFPHTSQLVLLLILTSFDLAPVRLQRRS